MSRVSEIAKEETTRQAIIVTFTVLGTVGIAYFMRKVDEPNIEQHTKMIVALAVKRFANKNVDFWQRVADKAATVYNRERA